MTSLLNTHSRLETQGKVSQDHYYAVPFSNKDQKIKQIALYILAALGVILAATLIAATIAGIMNPLIGPIAGSLLIFAALITFYVAKTTPFFKIAAGQIVSGPLGGLYEKNFLTALNYAKLKPVTEAAIQSRSDHPFFPKVKERYDRFIQSLQGPLPEKPLIPQKIHLIWIGLKPASETTQEVVASWQKFHPNWECKLWGNEDAAQVIQEMSEKFPQIQQTWDAAQSCAEKADILRYCILYREGGFYADTDLPCLSPIDELHYFSDFYCGIQEINDPEHSKFLPTIVCNNAAIGSRAEHPILKQMLQSLQPCPSSESCTEDILSRTGPILLAKIIREFSINSLEDNKNDTPLILPPIYFYPMPMQRSPLFITDYGYRPLEDSLPYLTPVSKAIHLWEGSWVKVRFADAQRVFSRLVSSKKRSS